MSDSERRQPHLQPGADAPTGRPRRWLPALIVVAAVALLNACGVAGAEPNHDPPATTTPGADPAAEVPGPPDSPLPAPTDQPMLVIERLPVIGTHARFWWVPSVYVTSDGVMITQGPTTLQHPGPALPNLRQRMLDADALARLRELASTAGLDETPLTYHTAPVLADTTRLTYLAPDGRTYVHQVYALGSTGDDGFSEGERAARAKLATFVREVTDPAVLGTGVGPDQAYVPQAFVVETPPANGVPPADTAPADTPPTPEPTVLPWPVTSVRLSQEMSCTPVTGPDAVALLDSMRQANELTRWSQDGHVFQVDVRVSLPGEGLCR